MFDLAPLVAASMLSVESRSWLSWGAKEQVVFDAFGVSAVRYYQFLNGLIESELALQLDPVTTRRLLAVRETRRLVG